MFDWKKKLAKPAIKVVGVVLGMALIGTWFGIFPSVVGYAIPWVKVTIGGLIAGIVGLMVGEWAAEKI